MMSVTQESVRSAFCVESVEFAGLRENVLIYFVINCHFGGHFVLILILFYIFVISYVSPTRSQRHS